MPHEQLINDTVYGHITLAPMDEVAATAEAQHESVLIHQLLETIASSEKDKIYYLAGHAHRIMQSVTAAAANGSSFTPTQNGGCSATLVFERCADPHQRVQLKYKLVISADEKRSWLYAKYNPTTIWNGSNVVPASFSRSPDGSPDCPSSNMQTMHAVYRMGFSSLSELFLQTRHNAAPELFSNSTKNTIDLGEISLIHVQWAAYLPTKDKALLTQRMTTLLSQRIARGKGVITLARYLGLEFQDFINFDTDIVPGILTRKRYGKKLVFSNSMYDKLVRLGQMRQQASLSEFERKLVTENIRFDMTAHTEGIMLIINAARKALPSLMRVDPKRFRGSWPQDFLVQQPKATVWWLERAIFILSHQPWAKGRLSHDTFGKWLVPYMLHDVLHLGSVTDFTPEAFQQFCAVEDKVAVAWRAIPKLEEPNWTSALAEKSGCSQSTVLNRHKEWLGKYRIDIMLPYAFYRDLLFFGPGAAASDADRQATIDATSNKDGKALMELRTKAARTFDSHRRNLIGATVKSTPVAMTPKSSSNEISGSNGVLPSADVAPEAEPELSTDVDELGIPIIDLLEDELESFDLSELAGPPAKPAKLARPKGLAGKGPLGIKAMSQRLRRQFAVKKAANRVK